MSRCVSGENSDTEHMTESIGFASIMLLLMLLMFVCINEFVCKPFNEGTSYSRAMTLSA